MSALIAWACPKCGTGADEFHERSKDDPSDCPCGGFVCECESDGGGGHGQTIKDPCPLANCYHCGWGGTFPTKRHAAKKNLVTCPHCNGTGMVKK